MRWSTLRGLGILAACLLIALLAMPLQAKEQPSPGGMWARLDPADEAAPGAVEWIQPLTYVGVSLDVDRLLAALDAAPPEVAGLTPQDGVEILLPDPEGVLERFRVVASPILSPEMAARHPGIRTWLGWSLDDPGASLRADWTVLGFRAQVLSPRRGAWYIDPLWREDTVRYASYYKGDLRNEEPFTCESVHDHSRAIQMPAPAAPLTLGTQLRTYRMAIAATTEYTTWAGSVANALASLTTTVNRMTGIYEIDVAVRLTLVGTSIHNGEPGDPYLAGDAGSTSGWAKCQTDLDAVVGSANYDVGHLIGQGGNGGVASGGCVCTATKAYGTTSRGTPAGDGFDVDYVAHEVGHQFSADHTWNGNQGSCASAGQWQAASAYEPGSATTIMGYAGICGSDDIPDQPCDTGGGTNCSDPYFHFRSQDQIHSFVSSACGTSTATGNTPPTANAGSDYTIPRSTPFVLTGSGSDPDAGASLTYCWEQADLGSQVPLNTVDDGAIPLFRSRSPTTSASRTFPIMADLLAGDVFPTKLGEQLPSQARAMDFRLTVRDNQAGGGGVDTDDMVVTVDAASGPFAVTYPNGGETLGAGSSATITWNVAGTTAAPVSTSNVDIHLSLDGGMTWTSLLTNTANDGSESVSLTCAMLTTTARIRVQAVGNIYFDVSDADFEIADVTPPSVVCSVARRLLWPPRLGMLPVGQSYAATDDCDPSLHVELRVHSNEAGGTTPPFDVDATMVGSWLRLRAERAWPGTGRVYVIAFIATDDAGNTTAACCSVVVPAVPTASQLSALTLAAAAKCTECEGLDGAAPAGYTQLLTQVLVP